MAASPDEPQAESANVLFDDHIAAINETRSGRRTELFLTAYAPSIRFVDPFFVANGHEELAAMYDALHEKFPGHLFEAAQPVQIHHGYARLRWNLIDGKNAVVHTGEDVLLIKAGKIGEILVFID